MARARGSVLPWLMAAGGLTAAWLIWRRSHRPYYPDIALQAGLELLSRPRRVLAIGTHPGDLERHAAGTLRLLAQNGSPVTMAVLSRGEKATNLANIAEIRTREQEAAATALGACLIQLDLPDGAIRPGPELEQALDLLWERSAPEVVITFDPKGPVPLPAPPDHLALGAAVLSRIRRSVTAGERVYCYGSPAPNVLVDITEVLQEKSTALLTHRSQLRGPDYLGRAHARQVSRLHSRSTPAIYTEAFYRLV